MKAKTAENSPFFKDRISFGKLPKKILLPLLAIIVLFLVTAPAYYFYTQYDNTQKMLKNPQELQKEEIKELVERVGRLIELPTEEEPTVTVVSEKNKAEYQSYFPTIKLGDDVLIFTKAKKAILYRASTNKIIDVAMLNIGSIPTPTAAPTPVVSSKPEAKTTPTPTPKKSLTPTPTPAAITVAMYNGTKVGGLTRTVETELKTKVSGLTVVYRGNATDNYTVTQVIDLSGKHKANALEIAKALSTSAKVVASVPTTETKPASGDILIILGTDVTQ